MSVIPRPGNRPTISGFFQETFSAIKQRCNAILSPSTGGGGADTNLKVLKAEMASVNLGSLSIGLFPIAKKSETGSSTGRNRILKARTMASSRIFLITYQAHPAQKIVLSQLEHSVRHGHGSQGDECEAGKQLA